MDLFRMLDQLKSFDFELGIRVSASLLSVICTGTDLGGINRMRA